MAQFS